MSPHSTEKSPTTCKNNANGDAIDGTATTSIEERYTACYGGERKDSVMPRGSCISPTMFDENGGRSGLVMPLLGSGEVWPGLKTASQPSEQLRTDLQGDEGYGTWKLATTIISAALRSKVETDGDTGKDYVKAEEEKEDEDDEGVSEGESTSEKQRTHDGGAEPDCVLIDPFPTSMQSSDHNSAKSELVVDTLIKHHSECVCESSYVANLPGKVVTGVTLPVVLCVGGEVCDPPVCARVPDRDSLYMGPDWKLFT